MAKTIVFWYVADHQSYIYVSLKAQCQWVQTQGDASMHRPGFFAVFVKEASYLFIEIKKSEPVSNRNQVRISPVKWSIPDSNRWPLQCECSALTRQSYFNPLPHSTLYQFLLYNILWFYYTRRHRPWPSLTFFPAAESECLLCFQSKCGNCKTLGFCKILLFILHIFKKCKR